VTVPSSNSQPDGALLHNLMLFGQVLRRAGLDVGSGNILDLVQATEHLPVSRKEDFRQAARCLLVHRKQDLPIFDEAFQVFWRRPAGDQTTHDLRSMGEQRRYRQPRVAPPAFESADTEGQGEGDGGGDRVDLGYSYSAREVLRAKDFGDFAPSEVTDARRMMAELAWDLGRRRTRRMTPGQGAALDWRRTLRRNLKYGGEWLELARRHPKDKPRSLALLCDVSGSMEQYTRMLLHFIHTIAGGLDRVEAFLFATRLTRITRCLRHRSVDQAINEVSRAVPDWSGGTRIGEAVKTFNYRWARRVLRSSSVVLVISDGWDRGEPELLGREMARLQRSCYRLVWLNPLLGSPEYQPLTRGMQAALPYVDDFLPVHNLNSLASLAQHLNQLSPRRSSTLQRHPPKDAAPEPAEHPSPQPAPPPIDPALAPTFRHPLWGKPQPRATPPSPC